MVKIQYYRIIINAIYRARNFAICSMRQVSCCMVTVILEQEHFQSFPEHWQWNVLRWIKGNQNVEPAAWVFGAEYQKRLEIQTRFQWTTNRKWHMANRMVTRLMTSRYLKRWRSWPQYVWGPISRIQSEIVDSFQWSTYRKWHLGHQMVTYPMTSRDPKRSRPYLRYIWNSGWKYLENRYR